MEGIPSHGNLVLSLNVILFYDYLKKNIFYIQTVSCIIISFLSYILVMLAFEQKIWHRNNIQSKQLCQFLAAYLEIISRLYGYQNCFYGYIASRSRRVFFSFFLLLDQR